jgi:hypothetical protein
LKEMVTAKRGKKQKNEDWVILKQLPKP